MDQRKQLRIGVVNTKGGVGKTTTAVYLAAAAHRLGRSVEFLDLDKQGSATSWLNRMDPVQGVTVTVANAYTLRRESSADVVVVDTSPGDPRDVELVTETSDFIIVPCEPGPLNDERTLETVKFLRARGANYGVALVQTKKRTKATQQTREHLLADAAVFDTEIPHREEITRSAHSWPTDLFGYDRLFDEIQQEVAA